MDLKRIVALVVISCMWLSQGIAVAAPRTGYILINTKNGQLLAANSEDESFMAASTMKLVTALAALDVLGPEHQFETSLSISGKRRGNVLVGDVVLLGQGDVELDLDDLMAMTLALRAQGIAKVTGRFLVSDAAFLRTGSVNPDQPPEAPYNAGVGPLSLAFGRTTLRRGEDGDFFSNPPSNERGPAWQFVIKENSKRGRAIPIQDVGMHTALNLQRLALQLGISLPNPDRAVADTQLRRIATIKSKPLGEMVKGMMIYSNNQLAETIGLASTLALKLNARTLAESAAGLWAQLKPQLAPTDWRGFQITNHSGLDPEAKATPAQLATLLRYGLEKHALPHTLPANAWSGSLSRRLVEEGRLHRVWAKTGSIDFAVALAGYLSPDEGGLWLFAILTDDPERREAYDALPEPTEAMRKEAKVWESAIKAHHDELLRQWMVGKF